MKPVMLTSPKEIEFKQKADETAELILRRIKNQKEQIIFNRLKDLKLMHLVKDMAKKRFKKMIIEQHADREEVWVDNGTYRGKHVVTFFNASEAEAKDEQFRMLLKYTFEPVSK
jgi:frataxin-like iron-binding protein CyaY